MRNATIKQADVLALNSAELMKLAGVKPGETDLLAGGPPCQAFSVFGKRLGIDDPRGQLPKQYLRLLVDLKPKAFMFENVFGLLTIHGGDTFKELCEQLSSPADGLSYNLSVYRLVGATYLLLHGDGDQAVPGLFRIRHPQMGPVVYSKASLQALGYPSTPSQEAYLVYELEPDDGLSGVDWDYAALPGKPASAALGHPFAVTLHDILMISKRNPHH